MPLTVYAESEYLALRRERDRLQARVSVLEDMRPVWAMSEAAWSPTGALASLWKELGVTNQTEAILAVRKLKGT